MTKVNIMIVEDDAITAMDIENQLKNLGYGVSAKVSNGKDAIQKAKENTPDLVLIDIVLKGEMDGIEAAEEIRNLFDIPVVFLTAFADKDRLERAKLTNPYGYILKPFQGKDLEVTIEMALYTGKVDAERKLVEEVLHQEKKLADGIINSLPGLFYMFYEEQFVRWNKRWEIITGYSHEELGRMSGPDFFEGADREHIADRMQAVYREGAATAEAELVTKDGRRIPYYFTGLRVVFDGKPYLVGMGIDISDRKQAEEALRESEEKYRSMMEAMGDAVYICSPDLRIEYMNPAMIKRTGRDAAGERCYKAINDIDERCPGCVYDRIQQGESVETEIVSPWDNRNYDVSHSPIFHDDGSISKMTIYRDITESKRLEKEIIGEKEFLNNLISLCPDGIIGVNEQGKISIFNQAVEKLTLYKAEDVIGKMSVADLYESLDKARFIKKNIYSPEHGGQGRLQNFETEIVTHAGNKLPIQLSATLLHKDGQEIGSVGFFHDISDRKQFEARLRDISIRDSLSGLFNHRHFHSVLGEELARTHRYKRPLSLVCFDLDNFKQYNDKLGHQEGDNIIRLVGQYLKEIIRRTDQTFRYGGDEFMILLPETIIANAHFTAEKFRKHFNSSFPYEALCKKYDLKPVTLSLGVAEVNSEDGPETLIKRADLAMYEAKRGGGNRTVEAGPKIGKTT